MKDIQIKDIQVGDTIVWTKFLRPNITITSTPVTLYGLVEYIERIQKYVVNHDKGTKELLESHGKLSDYTFLEDIDQDQIIDVIRVTGSKELLLGNDTSKWVWDSEGIIKETACMED